MTIQKKWFLINLVFFVVAIAALFAQVQTGNNSDLFFATSFERMVCADCGEEVWLWNFKSSILRSVFGVESKPSSPIGKEECSHENLKLPPPPEPAPVRPIPAEGNERERRAVKETISWIYYVYPFTESNWWLVSLLMFVVAVVALNLHVHYSKPKKFSRLRCFFRYCFYISAVLCVFFLMTGTIETSIFTDMARPDSYGVHASYLEAQIARIRSHLAAISQVTLALAFIVFGARMFALAKTKSTAYPGMHLQNKSIPGKGLL